MKSVKFNFYRHTSTQSVIQSSFIIYSRCLMISTNVKLQSAKIKQNYQIMFHVKCMHYRHSVIHTSDIIFYFYNKIYQYSNITYFNNICATSIENENIHEFTIKCTFILKMCSIQFSHNINFKNVHTHQNHIYEGKMLIILTDPLYFTFFF